MQKISKDMIISDLVQIDQNIIPILMREGMHCIGCPSAQAETLEEAALVHGLDPDVLVARLNADSLFCGRICTADSEKQLRSVPAAEVHSVPSAVCSALSYKLLRKENI